MGESCCPSRVARLSRLAGIRAQIGSVDQEGDKVAPIANPDAGKPLSDAERKHLFGQR